jgi:hypothetical protein
VVEKKENIGPLFLFLVDLVYSSTLRRVRTLRKIVYTI